MRKHPLAAYFLWAYALSWSVHIPLALSARGVLAQPLPSSLHFLGAYGPAVAALLVAGRTRGFAGWRDLWRRVTRWPIGAGWLLIAVFSPAALFFLSAFIVRLWSGLWPDFGQFGRIAEFPRLGWFGGWVLWTLTFGLGEELGWRGYALPCLQRRRSARLATLTLGLLWVGWHAPQFFYNYELSPFGVLAFSVSTLSGALVLTWLFNSTGGSVLVTTLWHGAFNTAVAGAQGPMAPLVSSLVILAAMVIARRTGPDLASPRTAGSPPPSHPERTKRG